MQLRTIAGAHAGEVQDYAYVAGKAALEAGTAERLDTPSAAATEPAPPEDTAPRGRKREGRSK